MTRRAATRDAANIVDGDCNKSKGEWVLESESVVERRGGDSEQEQANGDGEGDVEEGERERESSVAGDALFMGSQAQAQAHTPPAWHRASPDRADLTRQPAPSLGLSNRPPLPRAHVGQHSRGPTDFNILHKNTQQRTDTLLRV